MAPANVKCVVSFSSQDNKNPVENVLKADSNKKWLNSSTDKSGQLQAVFQLEKSIVISHIDIGTFWVFSIQLFVGRSTWPQGQKYIPLFPSCVCMEPADCKKGTNKVAMKLFKQDDFAKEAHNEPWDRLQVLCTQPFRKDVQFGLSVIRVMGETNDHFENISNNHMLSCQISPQPITALNNMKKTPAEIKKHFFGDQHSNFNTLSNNAKNNDSSMKTKLSKIGGSSEMSSDNEAVLSRNVKLVVAATSSATKYKLSNGGEESVHAMYNINHKKKITFKEEAKKFLENLDVENLDLANLTFADVRHKLERQKLRKLSKEERKCFFKMAQVFMERAANDDLCPDKNSKHSKDLSTTRQSHNRSSSNIPACEKNCSTPISEMKKRLERLPLASPQQKMTETDCTRKHFQPVELFSKSNNVPPPILYNHEGSTQSDVIGVDHIINTTEDKWLSKSCPSHSQNSSGKKIKVKPNPNHLQHKKATKISDAGTKSDKCGRSRNVNNKSCKRKRNEDSDNSCDDIDSDSFVSVQACPMCRENFPTSEIELHAAVCGTDVDDLYDCVISSPSDYDCGILSTNTFGEGACGYTEPESECPICGRKYPSSLLPSHADQCADNSFI